MLVIDGSQGEGGGQLLRTSLSLAALTGRPFLLNNIRANRPRPGLRPQHLTAVRAVASITDAELVGAELNSVKLEFRPQSPPQGGQYQFDVSEAAKGGSAGAVTLILQAIMWPLVFADAPSRLTLRGGTHVPFSPPFQYLAEVALPVFRKLGVRIDVDIETWGWYPAGGGEMTATIQPVHALRSLTLDHMATRVVTGVAAVTNLPSHIPQRMAQRARTLLEQSGFRPKLHPLRLRGPAPGAGMVLWMSGGGSTSLGRKGLASETVAETCVAEMRAFADSGAAVDRYLADQLLLPLSLAHGRSSFTTPLLSLHTLTNADILRQWLRVPIEMSGPGDRPAQVNVEGIGFGNA